MEEPKIKEVLPPKNEPTLNVGIVLEEDKKRELLFSTNSVPLILITDQGAKEVSAQKKIKISLIDNQLTTIIDGEALSHSGELELRTSAQSTTPLSSLKSGIQVGSITVGRGFHWQKEISAEFAGVLKIQVANDSIIVVNEITLEEYLCSVISSEMSPRCPIEFAKAQAVAARSWSLVFLGNKHPNKPYTICNDDCCQRYQGLTYVKESSVAAIAACRGEVLITSSNYVCPAYYSKSCGGCSDTAENIFGLEALGIDSVIDSKENYKKPSSLEFSDEKLCKKYFTSPTSLLSSPSFCSEEFVSSEALPLYLGSVDEVGSYYRWTHVVSAELLISNLQNKFHLKDVNYVTDVIFGDRGLSGRILNATVQYVTIKGEKKILHLKNQFEIRNLLHESFLFSSAFYSKIEHDGQGILTKMTLSGAGWGHGVGLCQIGALGMSLAGSDHTSILKHYFPNTKLTKSY